MAGTGLRLKNFYRQYIYPHYPALLVARRSLKIMAAMVLSLLILQPWPHLMTWGPLSAFLLSQVPPGLPLAARRKAMLVLTLATALLMPLATLAADGVALPTVFVILATFAAFWGAALGPAYGACGLWALLLVVVALGKPAPLDEGLGRAAAVALGGGLCWCFQFLVLPIRPRQIYSAALGLALDYLDQLWSLLEEAYPKGDVDPKRLEKLKSQALTALHRLRDIPQFLELPTAKLGGSSQAVLALGLDLVRVYENLLALWQVRQLASDWPLFQTRQGQILQGLALAHELLRELRQAQAGSTQRPDPSAVIHGLKQQVDDLRQQALENEDKRSVGDYVAVTNSLAALVSLARDLGRAEGQRRALELLQLPAQGRAAPSEFRTRLRQELRLDSPILRSSLQASVAAGVGMVLIKTRNLHNGYWVVLFALLVVKPDLGTTLAMGKRRVIGTVLGAAAAIFFLLEVASSGPPKAASRPGPAPRQLSGLGPGAGAQPGPGPALRRAVAARGPLVRPDAGPGGRRRAQPPPGGADPPGASAERPERPDTSHPHRPGRVPGQVQAPPPSAGSGPGPRRGVPAHGPGGGPDSRPAGPTDPVVLPVGAAPDGAGGGGSRHGGEFPGLVLIKLPFGKQPSLAYIMVPSDFVSQCARPRDRPRPDPGPPGPAPPKGFTGQFIDITCYLQLYPRLTGCWAQAARHPGALTGPRRPV
ncbi:MAG: FUSC family protein [Desulfarculus sp.]|nr:FUSC family protein [Desulfarculus sp.]